METIEVDVQAGNPVVAFDKGSRTRARIKAMAVNPDVKPIVPGALWQVAGTRRPYLVRRVFSGESTRLECDAECPAAQGGLCCYHIAAVELFEEDYGRG